MSTELKVLGNKNLPSPAEFGLEEKKGIEIMKSFEVIAVEREAYIQQYNEIITSEITEELCKSAKELRLKIRKPRLNAEKIRKTNKNFYLQAGRFIDAVGKKTKLDFELMESKLSEIENYFSLKEAKRIEELNIKRTAEYNKYIIPGIIEPSGVNLGAMDDQVYDTLIEGVKAKHANYLKAEAERKEAERKEREKAELEQKRRFKTSRLINFIPDYDNIVFSDLSEIEFNKLVNTAIDARTKKEEEEAAIKAENERLKKEAEEKEIALIKAEKERIEKEVAEQEARAKKEREEREKREAKEKAEREAREKAEAEKKAAFEAKLKAEREEKARIAAELQKKKEEEEAKEKARIAAEQAELSKGDTEKVQDLIKDIEALKTKYSFDAAKNQKMYASVSSLFDKTIKFIKDAK